jgi:hypothetical protein
MIELIKLAGYLESKSERGLFPKARFYRYSDTLLRLIEFLVKEAPDIELSSFAAILARRRTGTEPSPSLGSAKVLTHPRFRRRRKKGPGD